MAETDWSVYDKCELCFADIGQNCKSLKGAGQLTRAHRGRAKLNREEVAAAEPTEEIGTVTHQLVEALDLTDEQAEEAKPFELSDKAAYLEMAESVNEEVSKHNITVTRQRIGDHDTWRASCGCGDWVGHYWGDDVSPKREWERHVVAATV